jgi:hypothetical protein
MQLLSFERSDAWLTDVTLSGDAWMARALRSKRDARVHALGVLSLDTGLHGLHEP